MEALRSSRSAEPNRIYIALNCFGVATACLLQFILLKSCYLPAEVEDLKSFGYIWAHCHDIQLSGVFIPLISLLQVAKVALQHSDRSKRRGFGAQHSWA